MYESEATAAVYASLALLSADQTGKSVVTLTTNGPVTALDDIDVFKGTKEVEIDSIDYEDDGAVVTLKNAIVADAEYTVTLTPADEDDEATSATFTGEKAKLDRIEFLNNVLVMKDTNYNEGYAYVKGYDQFDDPVTLSGLTVTPGVGRFKSYDNATGKITIVDENWKTGSTGAFMLIKEVPMFVQYQTGNDIISAQAVLSVSTQAFVNELEFGEVKKDGTMREDGLLTLEELGSGKYYVEIEEVLDQYGNTLSAEDLNTQKSDDNKAKTLFVIPDDKGGAFYRTGDFGELNGKTILWLASAGANAKPGTMTLTITGAGGKTFSKDITVVDNPYIDVLNVTYPELYSGSAQSAELEFSAVDQYGTEIDLWTMRPKNDGTDTIYFGDKNAMTGLPTTIKVSGTGNPAFNTIVSDAGKKTFKVTLDVSTVPSKTLITFTEQTAGMNVSTRSITVGEMGTAAKVKSALKSGANLQLDAAGIGTNTEVNFNKFIQFEDANGNEMIRGKSEKYPYYIAIHGKKIEETLPLSTSDVWKNYGYVWSLTNKKVEDTNANADGTTTTAVTDYDLGVVKRGDIAGSSLDVYATVYLAVNGTFYKLDEKKFHLTTVQGDDKSYTAKAKNTIFCSADNGKSTKIEVTATTDSGETYTVDNSRVQVVPKAPFEVPAGGSNEVSGSAASGSGTTTATVYVKEYKDGVIGAVSAEETTVNIEYTDAAPVATKVYKKFKIEPVYTANTGAERSKVGKDFDGDFTEDSFTLGGDASLEITDGELKITRANNVEDTLTFGINDQYGRSLKSTVFYVDGVKVTGDTTVNTSAKDVTIEWANGTLTGKVILENGGANKTLKCKSITSTTVKTLPGLKAALAGSYDKIVVDADIVAKEDITIPANKTVEIPSNRTVTVLEDATPQANPTTLSIGTGSELLVNGSLTTGIDNANAAAGKKTSVENNGKITVNGTWDHAGDSQNNTGKITNNGTVTGSGHVTVDSTEIAQGTDGTFNVTGSTLVLTGATTLDGGKISGHVMLGVTAGDTITIGGTTAVTLSGNVDVGGTVNGTASKAILDDKTVVTILNSTATMTDMTVEKGETITVVMPSGSSETATAKSDANATDVAIGSTGATSASSGITSTVSGDGVVSDAEEFAAAAGNLDISVITLKNDITLPADNDVHVTHPLTIDLQGHKLTTNGSLWIEGTNVTVTGKTGSQLLKGSAEYAITVSTTADGTKTAKLAITGNAVCDMVNTYWFVNMNKNKPVVTGGKFNATNNITALRATLFTAITLDGVDLSNFTPADVTINNTALTASAWTAGSSTENANGTGMDDYKTVLTATIS